MDGGPIHAVPAFHTGIPPYSAASMPAVHHAPLMCLAMLCASVAPCGLVRADEAMPRGGGAADTIAADEQVQAAVAAVLVASLGERFDDPALELRLGPAEVETSGERDHVVRGTGQLRLAGSGGEDWLAFRYRSRYDPVFGTAGYAEVSLGGDGEAEGERFVPNDARLLVDLETRLAVTFESRPGAGRVFLQLDDVSSLQSGERFLRIDASGLVDFGPGGSTTASVDALYDLQAKHWLSIEHVLAPNIVAHGDGATAGY